jgi:amino-acid N-acetyltransferase
MNADRTRITADADAMNIAQARAEDFGAVAALLDAVNLPVAGLAEHFDAALVACEGSVVVGSAALELYGTAALLRSVAVAPSHQGEGLGQRLVAAALDEARRRGVREVYLLTNTANGFFPRFGFRTVERNGVPESVKTSAEFTSACPASTPVLTLTL